MSAPTHDDHNHGRERDRLFAALQRALQPQYRLESELGRGGMGVVYLAVDTALERRVAVKVVHPDLAAHESITRRFLAEARLIARLRHPNIVTVHAAGSVDATDAEGRPGGSPLLWYAMDEVPGETLRDRLRREGALPTADAARILGDLASALDAAGRAGVVHRDVKPENVLLDATSGRALLVDFGIARAMLGADEGAGPTTGRGVAIGTPTYMSPEQAAGEEIDHRSDLYALGIVGYEMLAGRPPFEGPGRVVVSKHLAERPAPLARARPDCPPALAAAVMRALEKVPAERWQTGEELRQAILGERPVPLAPPSRRARRRRLAGALVAAALVLGLGGTAVARWRDDGPPAGVNPRHSILVLPFRNVRNTPDVAWLRDASVSMLGLNLSQWRDLTVVDQERVHDLLAERDLHDRAEIGLETARRMARDAGAWTVVMGDYEQVGDSLQLVARVYDVATGARLETARAGGLARDDVRPLFDELAARLLDLSGAPSGTATGLAATTTSSLAAFRWYLTGLEHLNHWDLVAAEAAFRAATAIDSTFGLAYYRLALTRGWLVGTEDSVATQAMNRASAYVTRLPPHDRTLLTAYRAFVQGDFGTARELYGELLGRDSTDADAWYGLGEAWYHDMQPDLPVTTRWSSALGAFRRTLSLDAGYALAYEHVDEMLATAGRRGTGIALVAPDSFALVDGGPGRPAMSEAEYAAARTRARQEALALARAWVAAQPTTARAHGALVDAHLAMRDYDGARAELQRFDQVAPGHVQRPFVEARIRFAAGQVDEAAEGLRGVLDSMSSRDFRRNADRPTVVEDVAAAANVFAYQGDLDNARRALLLADEVRREMGHDMRPGGDPTPPEHWHRKTVGELYAAMGADPGTLRRLWAGTAEASRTSPPEQRKMVAFTGATAAIGLLAESGDGSAVEELRALTGDSLPGEVRALLALERGDSSAARRHLQEPDHWKGSYLVFRRPLRAQVHVELGEYDRALAVLADLEPENLPVRGFDPRWGHIGRIRLLRAYAHERLGHREAALAEYRRAAEQWRTAASPELQPLLDQALRGVARMSGVG